MMAGTTPDLVTIGGLTVDNVIAADGTVGLGHAGGNGAYAAVGALSFVPRVGLVSHAVASYPRDVLGRLEAGGVDLGGVRWSDDRVSGANWFIYDDRGDRDESLVSAPGALAEAGFPTDRLEPDQIAAWRSHLAARCGDTEESYSEFRVRHPLQPDQVPKAWHGVRGVHLAPSGLDVMMGMADLFGGDQTVVTADTGWQLAGHDLDALAPLLARIDAFLPSEVELRALVPGAGLNDALQHVAARSRGAVAVKVGPRGALVWDRATGSAVHVPAENVEARDPTGAGDSFCGGFLAGLVKTGDPVLAARFGAVAAARVVGSFGADGALPVDRVAMRARLGGAHATRVSAA